MRVLRRLLGITFLPLALWLVLPLLSEGSSPQAHLSSLQSQIDKTRGELSDKQGTARVLTGDIAEWNDKIDAIQSRITTLERKRDAIQSDLDRKRADLVRTQTRLRAERARLERLRARLRTSRRVLARRLVELYETDRPDLVSVVLNANGFADLLEQGDFIRRIGRQDQAIIEAVRTARTQTVRTAQQLAGLEEHQQQVAAAVLSRRNQVAQVKQQLVDTRTGYKRTRAGKARALHHVKAQAADLKGHLDSLEAASAKVQAELQAAQTPSPAAGPPAPSGSGALIWPVSGPITSPFCESRSWESCHPGIDIGVPEGTPIHAAAAGTVVLMQNEASSGGYGNFTCIQHTSTMSTCYAHQSRFATSTGAHVSQGQVIGYTGCTGRCFGPHLHFEVRINGAVVNPLNYL